MEIKQIFELLEKRRSGLLTPEEATILESWYNLRAADDHNDISDEDLKKNLDTIGEQLPLRSAIKTMNPWPRIAAAASIVFVLGLAAYYLTRKSQALQVVTIVTRHDIAPARKTATLILANGKKIILSTAVNGKIASEAGVSISKSKNGQVAYTVTAVGNSLASPQNTLSTSNGETYQVHLPDGTRVWLNAASSLTYPTRFSGLERRVTLTGEAYFEVAKDKRHPFMVMTDKQEVTVLGTHFNIQAYKNEQAYKTTLLEGKVNVRAVSENRIYTLKPGQQASGRDGLKISTVNTEDVVGWKNGVFLLHNESLKEIMGEVERWYNVDVDLDQLPNELFYGEIKRDVPLSQVLEMIETTSNIKLKIAGRRVIVIK